MHSNRRQFLKQLVTASLGIPLISCDFFIEPPRSGLIIGGGRYADANSSAIKYVLAIVDTNKPSPSLINLPFLPHGVAFSQKNRSRLMLFEKIGPGACEVDIETNELVRVIDKHPQRFFYGHGAFSRDEKLIYSTETYLDSYRGVIAVRDAQTMELVGEFPTYGDSPHDCQLIESGRVMLITNGGGSLGSNKKPAVTYVDVDSEKLLERIEIDNEQFNAGHIARAQNGSIAVVSAPRKGLTENDLGGVSLRSAKSQSLISMREPRDVIDRMQGEALSVAIHDSLDTVAVTHPTANMITFWSMSENRLLQKLDFERPRGVTLSTDKSRFILSYGHTANLVAIDAESLQIIDGSVQQSTFITGSHIYNWDAEASSA